MYVCTYVCMNVCMFNCSCISSNECVRIRIIFCLVGCVYICLLVSACCCDVPRNQSAGAESAVAGAESA